MTAGVASKTAYRPDIDGLRAIAVLTVVIYHAFPGLIPGGFIGVDIFFVISGYLISRILLAGLADGSFDLVHFYARRVRRIFPALLLVLLACFGLGWFILLPHEYQQLGKHILASAGFAQNLALLSESGYFDNSAEAKPLLHLWSLGVEEQFYVVWPLILWLSWKRRLSPGLVCVSLALLSFGLCVIGTSENPPSGFFSPISRIWELLCGGSLAWVQTNANDGEDAQATGQPYHLWVSNGKALSGICLLVYGFWNIQTDGFPGAWALIPVAGAVLVIAAGMSSWLNRVILAHRYMVAVGLMSYPLYLWHWPLLAFVRIEAGGFADDIHLLAAVLASVFAAWATYFFVERPIRSGKSSLTIYTPKILGTAMAVVGALGAVAYASGGIEDRGGYLEVKAANASMLRAFDAEAMPWSSTWRTRESYCKDTFPLHWANGYCGSSSGPNPTVVLVGDSHAAVAYAGLRDELEQENVLMLGSEAQPPFFGMTSWATSSSSSELASRFAVSNKMMLVAESSPGAKVVVMWSRGPGYLTGRSIFGSFPKSHLYSTDRPELSDRFQIWEDSMRRTLERLEARGKRIIYVLDVPELNFDPRSCLDLRRIRLSLSNRNYCGVSRSSFDLRNESYRRLVTKVLQDFPSVVLFDAAQPLCDEVACRATKDSLMLYSDDQHLSIDGSRYVATFLALEVSKLLKSD